MLTLNLALRNIPAHGQRNLIIATVTAAVSAFLFLFLCFSDGELENIKAGLAGFANPPSDLTVSAQGRRFAADRHQDTRELTVKNWPALRQELESRPEVREAVPRVWGGRIDLFWKGKKYLGFWGIAAASPDAFLHSRYHLVTGTDLAPGTDGFLLHQAARSTISLVPGDRVTFVGNDFFGQVISRDMTFRGYFQPETDNPNLYGVALVDTADHAVTAGYAPDEAHQLLVRLRPGQDARRAADALKTWAASRNLEVDITDAQSDNGYVMVFGMVRIILVVMVLLTLVITGFGIMNVVSVNLHDRRKEIGTYFCLGSEKPFLLRLYTWEILFVNLGGALAGLILGLLLREGINALGITSADPGFQIVMGGSRFHLGLSASSVLWIFGGVTLITILTALTTLGKALNVAPVVAVRDAED